MTTVAITGVGGLVGRRVAAALDDDAGIDRIVGIDRVVPGELSSSKLVFREADVRDERLGELFEGVDVVVHLASWVNPSRDEAAMRSVNVDGTRNLLEQAVAAGVAQVVYVSSAVVYGAHPDNDFPLTEDSPLRANPDFSYAEQKREVEDLLWPFAAAHPHLTLTVLRPSIIVGRGVENFVTRQLLDSPRYIGVRNHEPPMQFAHVEDVASAVVHAIEHRLAGAYNVTSEGWLSFDEILAIAGRKVLELPEEVAFSVADRAWRFGLVPAPAGAVNYVMYPWVVSVDKLVQTGWRPRHSNRDALAEAAAEHRDWLAIGPVRAHRSTMRRVAAVAALSGAAAVATTVARRRR